MTPKQAITKVIQRDHLKIKKNQIDFPLLLNMIRKERIHLPKDLPEEDVFGTAVLALYQAAKHYKLKHKVKLMTYAYRHIQGAIKDLSKKENKYFRRNNELRATDVNHLPTKTNHEADYATGQLHGQLRRHVKLLPERQMAVILKLFYEDLTIAETAKSLGISQAAVVALRDKGLGNLRQYFKKN